MKLNDLSPAKGAKKKKKRLGRGPGSGNGTTAGRGTKGLKARSGGRARPGYEGGQMPIHRRLPKFGFKNIFRKKFSIINIRDLARFESGEVVDEISLVKKGLVKGSRDGIKLLGQGEINIPLTIKVHLVSKGAQQKIEAAGGKIEVI
jgi:large subunit ribosomal protein L15